MCPVLSRPVQRLHWRHHLPGLPPWCERRMGCACDGMCMGMAYTVMPDASTSTGFLQAFGTHLPVFPVPRLPCCLLHATPAHPKSWPPTTASKESPMCLCHVSLLGERHYFYCVSTSTYQPMSSMRPCLFSPPKVGCPLMPTAVCLLSGTGTYQPAANSSSCISAPAGTYTNLGPNANPGASTYTACPVGTYTQYAGSNFCQ